MILDILERKRKCKHRKVCKYYKDDSYVCNIDPTEYDCESKYAEDL